MELGSPVEALAASYHHALLIGLEPLKVEQFTFVGEPDPVTKSRRKSTGEFKDQRPYSGNVETFIFPQTWSSTALGFGGVGGQAFTAAYTVVVTGPQGDACVYFGGRFAYRVPRLSQVFMEDLRSHSMVSRMEMGKYDTKKAT